MKKIEKVCYNTIRELGREIVYNFNFGEQLTDNQKHYIINNCNNWQDIEEYFYNDVIPYDLGVKEYEEDIIYNHYYDVISACEKENVKVGDYAKDKILEIIREELQFTYNIRNLVRQSGLDYDEID